MFAQYIDSSFGYMSCVCRKNYRHNNDKVVLCLANTLLVYVSNCTEGMCLQQNIYIVMIGQSYSWWLNYFFQTECETVKCEQEHKNKWTRVKRKKVHKTMKLPLPLYLYANIRLGKRTSRKSNARGRISLMEQLRS